MTNKEYEQFVLECGNDILNFCKIHTMDDNYGWELYQEAMYTILKKKEKIDITNNVKSYAIPDDAWDDSVGDLREEYWHALDTFDGDELIIKVTFENGEIQEKKYELHTAKVNIENGVVFSKDGDAIWECSNCGHIHIGPNAPEMCPVCAHPRDHFQLRATNY